MMSTEFKDLRSFVNNLRIVAGERRDYAKISAALHNLKQNHEKIAKLHDTERAVLLADLVSIGFYPYVLDVLNLILDNASADFKQLHQTKIYALTSRIPMINSAIATGKKSQIAIEDYALRIEKVNALFPREPYQVKTVTQASALYDGYETFVIDNNPLWLSSLDALSRVFKHLSPWQQNNAIEVVLHALRVDKEAITTAAIRALTPELCAQMTALQRVEAIYRLQQINETLSSDISVKHILHRLTSINPVAARNDWLNYATDMLTRAQIMLHVSGEALTLFWPIAMVYAFYNQNFTAYPPVQPNVWGNRFINEGIKDIWNSSVELCKQGFNNGPISAVMGLTLATLNFGFYGSTFLAVGLAASAIEVVVRIAAGIVGTLVFGVLASASTVVGGLSSATTVINSMLSYVPMPFKAAVSSKSVVPRSFTPLWNRMNRGFSNVTATAATILGFPKFKPAPALELRSFSHSRLA